mmetsp:Transcript_23515/g.36202  ORF Transcript_23515/g.36202 Transcript_23515/m.36202 type:complete len:88 (+) Transcript_23515:613-876(+)
MMEARENQTTEDSQPDEIRLVSKPSPSPEKPATSILKKPTRPSPTKEEIKDHKEHSSASQSPFSMTVVEREPPVMQPIKFDKPPAEE